jgi:hypothetical protein
MPRSVFPLDSVDAMAPIFQAGHAGSIPVARSTEPQVRNDFLARSQLTQGRRARRPLGFRQIAMTLDVEP